MFRYGWEWTYVLIATFLTVAVGFLAFLIERTETTSTAAHDWLVTALQLSAVALVVRLVDGLALQPGPARTKRFTSGWYETLFMIAVIASLMTTEHDAELLMARWQWFLASTILLVITLVNVWRAWPQIVLDQRYLSLIWHPERWRYEPSSMGIYLACAAAPVIALTPIADAFTWSLAFGNFLFGAIMKLISANPRVLAFKFAPKSHESEFMLRQE